MPSRIKARQTSCAREGAMACPSSLWLVLWASSECALRLTSIISERTSAATDLFLAMVSLGSSIFLAQMEGPSFKLGILSLSLAMTGLGNILAAFGHGLEFEVRLEKVVWGLSCVIFGQGWCLFAVGTAIDVWGQETAYKLMPWFLGLAWYWR